MRQMLLWRVLQHSSRRFRWFFPRDSHSGHVLEQISGAQYAEPADPQAAISIADRMSNSN